MRTLATILFIAVATIGAFAQQEASIVGHWKFDHIEAIPEGPDQAKSVEMLESFFSDIELEFMASGKWIGRFFSKGEGDYALSEDRKELTIDDNGNIVPIEIHTLSDQYLKFGTGTSPGIIVLKRKKK